VEFEQTAIFRDSQLTTLDFTCNSALL
jgi:hypothetical protein